MKALSKAVLAIYILLLLWLVLFKFSLHIVETFDFTIRGLNLMPFVDTSQSNWRDASYNILFFVPLGLLLSANFKRSGLGQKLAYIFYFSLAAEVIQFAFAIGITDITDLITNTTGGLLGLMLYELGQKRFGGQKIDKWVTVMGGAMSVLLFVFIFSMQLAHERNRPQLPLNARPGASHEVTFD